MSSKHEHQRCGHHDAGACGDGAQRRPVGERALEDRTDRVQEAEDEAVDRQHAPAHLVGRVRLRDAGEGREGKPVARPDQRQAGRSEPQRGRASVEEESEAHPERGDEHHAASTVSPGDRTERERCSDRADALRGDEQRRRALIAAEDVRGELRDEGDEGRTHTDHDRHHADHAAHRRVRSGEAGAIGERSEDRAVDRRPLGEADLRHGEDDGEEAERVDPQGQADAAERDRQPGNGRSDDATQVPLRVGQAHCGDEVLASNQFREGDLERGKDERVDRAGDEAEDCDAEWARRAAAHPDREHGGDHRRDEVAEHEDPPPVQAIGHRRSDRAEHGARQETCGRHHGRPRRLPGGVGDVVAQRHGLHPRADVRGQCPGPHQPEVTRPERSGRRRRHGGRRYPRPSVTSTSASPAMARPELCQRLTRSRSMRNARSTVLAG